MKISIEYCVQWDYEPNAASLAADIKKKYGVKPRYIKSGGGVFEIVVDGELVFSKKAEGRFPEHSEVFAAIDALKG